LHRIEVRSTRFAPLVLALVVIGGPIASTTCQAMCAERDSQSTAPHHSCHEHMVAHDGPIIAAIHVCGHDESLPTALERVTPAFDTPAVAPNAIVVMPPVRACASHVAFIDSSPPIPRPTNSQLRI
jgi:hypothetical protein